NAVEGRIKKHHPIIIYPEAKIWPCYTGIRPFKTASFKYPVKYNVPCYSMTTTYQKTKRGKCKIVIYVDGPFYPDSNLTQKENEIMLHDKIYNQMTERAKNSNYESYTYIKKGETND
ncbi:MAG: 1-acyl-sn-glycerol-3-phosphate acyltransferase, partial [Christensenellales bacterium]